MFKKILAKVWAALKKIGAGIVWCLKRLFDFVTDEKDHLDERRVLGIACYVVGIKLALMVPSLVLATKDLAAAGSMAAVIVALFTAGAALLNVARKADAAILANLPPPVAAAASAIVSAVTSEPPAKDGN